MKGGGPAEKKGSYHFPKGRCFGQGKRPVVRGEKRGEKWRLETPNYGLPIGGKGEKSYGRQTDVVPC